MPIPFIIGAIVAVAGATGIGAGAYGAKKMYDANETMERAKSKYNNSKELVEKANEKTIWQMDRVGKFELKIIKSFEGYADTIEKIQNRPDFAEIKIGEINIPKFTAEELKQAYVGAAVLLGGLSGAGLGAASGFAAAGATTSAIMAFGAASTGTAISSLSGVAATNAVLAWLGGGSLAAGGGGMALGATVLSSATLGIGLLVGGAVFAFAGSKMSDKAEEAWEQACKVEKQANNIKHRLDEIFDIGYDFYSALHKINNIYEEYMNRLIMIVDGRKKRNFNDFTYEEIETLQITTDLVGLLFNMCKVQLTKESEHDSSEKVANSHAIRTAIKESDTVLENLPIAAYQNV